MDGLDLITRVGGILSGLLVSDYENYKKIDLVSNKGSKMEIAEIVLANEIDKYKDIANAYSQNHKDRLMINKDITRSGVVVGGTPCQP